jgi:hypothetical protein
VCGALKSINKKVNKGKRGKRGTEKRGEDNASKMFKLRYRSGVEKDYVIIMGGKLFRGLSFFLLFITPSCLHPTNPILN